MYDLEIKTISYEDCTIGRLWYMDFQCFTLELPWLDNKRNISCVPEGRYRAKKHISPSLGDVLYILDVDGRDWIYIHPGNYTSDIQGCVLVGDSVRFINQDPIPDVSNSRHTFKRLYNMLPDEFWVEIVREVHV